MVVSQELSDEAEAMNAIFGEGTIQITKSTKQETTAMIKLPHVSYETRWEVSDIRHVVFTTMAKRTSVNPNITFLVEFPTDYPTSMPRVVGIATASMFEYSNGQLWKHELALGILLQTVFEAGHECMFDWLSICAPVIASLSKEGMDWAKLEMLSPELTLNEGNWRWTSRSRPINLTQAFELLSCVICLDDQVKYRLIDLPCSDHFCFYCFQEGWNSAVVEADAYTCCRIRIPVPTIREYLKISNDAAKRYARTLRAIDTPEPVFCPMSACGDVMGSLRKLRSTNVRAPVDCPFCKVSVCNSCWQTWHISECIDAEEQGWMVDVGARRCPWCGQTTIKNGGCDHMVCQRCKKDYWWMPNGGTRRAERGTFD